MDKFENLIHQIEITDLKLEQEALSIVLHKLDLTYDIYKASVEEYTGNKKRKMQSQTYF